MADREDTSSLSAEEKIAQILDALGDRIDSQAERLTAQLEPVEQKVSAIEEQLRILGYERSTSSEPHERYRPRETTRSSPDHPAPSNPGSREYEEAESEAPRPADSEFENSGFEEPQFEETKDVGSGEAAPLGAAFDDPEFDEAEFEKLKSEAIQNEDSAFGDASGDEAEFEQPNPMAPEFEDPAMADPAPTPPDPGVPDFEPEEFQASDMPGADIGTGTADDRAVANDDQGARDLPFDADRTSDEDLSLADEALKSDLVGLFDDGEHADRRPHPADPILAPTPFPTAAEPARSRPVYLLVVAVLFLAASLGIGAFIWFELTSPELPFAAADPLPGETSTSAASPATQPAATTAPAPPTTTAAETPRSAPARNEPAPVKPPAAEPAPAVPATVKSSAAEPPAAEPAPPASPVAALPDPKLNAGTTPAEPAATPDTPASPAPAPVFSPEIEALRNSAAAGDSEAQYEIAVRYLVGRGVEQDYAEVAKWLQEAAAGGVVSAQYNLGVLYDSGRGVESDPVEALIWFHSAAEKGHGRAHYALAAAYAAGRGIARDSDMALKWLRRAAEENILEAQTSLANILATSPVSHNSLKDAYYWYRLADANGDANAADRAEQVAARLTPEERADVNRRVSAFVAGSIAGKRPRTLPPAPPAPPAAVPAEETPGASAPKPDAQTGDSAENSSRAQVRDIQALLTTLGFDPGALDGSLGDKTREAIRNYQRALGLDMDGEPSDALLDHMRQLAGVRR